MTVSEEKISSRAWGDLGNGRYGNPILPADYSDPDIIRVGKDYYLITSTFVQSPGITILHSADLVNWEIIGGAVRNLTQISPRYDYTVMDGYGRGIWAPCITYYEGRKRFYIHFGDPDYGMYMVYTDDIYGEWSDVQEVLLPDGKGLGAGWDDCSVLWDEDGQAYFAAVHFADGYKDHIFKMNQDGYHLEDNGVVVHQSEDGFYAAGERNPEALKLFKKDGMYYLFHNGVTDGKRKAFVMKASGIYGDLWDGTPGTAGHPGRYLHMPYPVAEGEREPNQGNFVSIKSDAGEEKWFFLTHHGKTDRDGRPCSLLPVTWDSQGWPVAETQECFFSGQMPIQQIEKPVKGSKRIAPGTSDDFESEKLGGQWMWNYQPRSGFWSLTQRPGYLRLLAFPPLVKDTLNKAGNSLIQRMYRSDRNVVTVKMDVSNMADGQFAGLLYMMGGSAAGIGVCRRNGVLFWRFKANDAASDRKISGIGRYVYLRAEWGYEMRVSSYYSADGKEYVPFGEHFQIKGCNYRGGHIGLFCYNDISENGYADFAYFHYEM